MDIKFPLTFNGVEYPTPTTYKVDYEPIVDASRNANGDMILEYITEKRKVNLTWQMMNGEDYKKIINSRKGSNISGILLCFDPSANDFVEMMAYASPISAPLFVYKNNIQMWENVTVNFIEL